MNLTPQEMSEILGALYKAEVTDGREKRRSTRNSVFTAVAISPPVQNPNWTFTGLVRDVSIHGVGLLLSHKMNRAEQFLARFPRGDKRPPLVIHCVAATCRQVASELFSVGAEFAARVDEPPLAASPPAATPGAAKPVPV